MTDSCGRRSNSARATVRPPIPESKTPSGALFMDGNADADTARKGADFEIRWKIAQMGRDVRLGAREEMIEDPEHEPVLHLLALEPEVFRVNLLEVVGLLLRLEGHHGRDAFPEHEHRARHRPPRGRLTPSRKEERPEESAHGPDAAMHGVGGEDDVTRISSARGILSGKSDGWKVGKCNRDGAYRPTVQPSNLPSHWATNTFNRPRTSSTVHSFTPGSRNSPSTCSMSGSSGERTTSFAVLMIATSRIFTCVPRITRGMARRNRGSETRRIKQTSIFPSAGSASGAKR